MTDHPLDASVESRMRANPHVRFGGRRRGNQPAKAGHGASPSTLLIADRVWRTRGQLELAIVEWVAWFNTDRLHESLADIPPAEFEALYAPTSQTITSTISIF